MGRKGVRRGRGNMYKRGGEVEEGEEGREEIGRR